MAVAAFLLLHSIFADVNVRPTDCDPNHGCGEAIAFAIQKCNATNASPRHMESCAVVLAPGRYRVECPTAKLGQFPYITTPGAVDLSGTSNIVFGAADLSKPAYLDIDYIANGCPAVAASHARNVIVQNLIIDCQRLPFTQGTVVSSSGSKLSLRVTDPAREVFDTDKYPWLLEMWDGGRSWAGFSNATFDNVSGIASIFYPGPAPAFKPGTTVNSKHYQNMQAWGVYGWMVRDLFQISGVTLLTAAGMGFRCDFCEGTALVTHSAIQKPKGRLLSTTADGIHFMHHRGAVIVNNTLVADTGDDCLNVHSNFFVLSNFSADRRMATYIDETGPGWIPAAPTYMVGDKVAFYSRLTLQQIGPANTLVSATGGYGGMATLGFAQPVPPHVLCYDMMLSLDRVASFEAQRNTFRPGGRGMVLSAVDVKVINNTFLNLHAANILFLEGGCGAYEDYTEGPFAADILIRDNSFSLAPVRMMHSQTQGEGLVQLGGCRPIGECVPVPEGTLGPRPTAQAYRIPTAYENFTRAVEVAIPTGLRGEERQPLAVDALEFYDDCAPGLASASMGLYASTNQNASSSPGQLLALSHWSTSTGGCPANGPGWRQARLSPPVTLPRGSQVVWLAHAYPEGAWNTLATTGTHKFVQGVGIPTSLVGAHWRQYQPNGVPLRMHVQGWGHTGSSTHGDPWSPMGDVPPSAEPPCQANGSSAPPVQTHTSDNAPGGSPGRITEPGQPLAGGLKIYRNISIVTNTFMAAHDSVPHFVDIGASDGITFAGNTMSSTTEPFDTEIHIYSSSGFDISAMIKDNTCIVSGVSKKCHVVETES